MKKLVTIVVSVIILNTIFLQIATAQKKTIPEKVDSVLNLMTLAEKIGQLNQYNDDLAATGPVTSDTNKVVQIQKGGVGSILNCMGAERTRSWQKIAMQSRL